MAANPPMESAPDPIPTYRIDLSLPPAERYAQVATELAPKMQAITPLFDEVLAVMVPWAWLRRLLEWISTRVLRRVCSAEETQELKGISKASGVDLYFLVALNVLLDSLMGCTSGGALTKPENRKGTESNPGDAGERTPRMMHFRTLDWGMDQLRSILVVLEFVRSKSDTPHQVIARTITYAGFVGVLTGVRPNLSISLNFRSTHSCSILKLGIHQLAVLFGFRPSVASTLRRILLPDDAPPHLEQLVTTLAETRSTPCYLILSSGSSTTVVEKDLLAGKVRSASNFIVHTNHDIQITDTGDPTPPQKEKSSILGMDAFLEESEERQDCMKKKWDSLVKRQEKRRNEKGECSKEGASGATVVRESTLKGWVKTFPIMNECSHFGCVMDPTTGTIRWLGRGVLEEESDEK